MRGEKGFRFHLFVEAGTLSGRHFVVIEEVFGSLMGRVMDTGRGVLVWTTGHREP